MDAYDGYEFIRVHVTLILGIHGNWTTNLG